MNRRFLVLGVSCILLLASLVPLARHPAATHAQELTSEARAALQAQYDQLQKEIVAQQAIIDATKAQERSLHGDITTLSAQVTAAQKQIDAKNIQLRQLASQIATKTKTIGELESRIERGKESLASMLRQEAQIEDVSVVLIALNAESVSSFFSDVDSFVSIKDDLRQVFSDIRATQAKTADERAALAGTQDKVTDAKYEVQTKQQQIASNKTQKQQLLAITKNQEAQYQQLLAANQKKAAAIRAALFPLRDAAAIPFGTALKYAQQAQRQTGVRAAFMLAVLTQESNLGANVGQCYLTNDATGAGVGKNTGTPFAKVMAPLRDVPPFLRLAGKLGFDPHRQVVSCPQQAGWGGAMGPAQFIPSTWVLYEGRVASIRGVAVANPWDPADAITAMSLLLADNGAAGGGYTAERNAACRYFSGSACPGTGGWIDGYGTQVIAKAASIQQNIDFLADNS